MKKVCIVGGAGTIGDILCNSLYKQYEITSLDLQPNENQNVKHVTVDATNYEQLIEKIPNNIDVIINLLATKTNRSLEDIKTVNNMVEIFLKASYHILLAAAKQHIPKVIFASSNHVTDFYEDNGHSLLEREITIKDYPFSKGIYGTLKLASENLGHIFSNEKGINVINIRIGSVPKDEQKSLIENRRLERTLLTREDLVQLFSKAIDAEIQYGTYYGVSNNIGKPWDIENVKEELAFDPKKSAQDVLNECYNRKN